MSQYNVLYFDDSATDRLDYSRRLKRHGLDVAVSAPPPNLALTVVTERAWDLVLVDHELIGGGPNADKVTYRGPTLATALRDIVDESPVVLFTKEDLLSKQDARRLLESSPVFDDVLYKGDVDTDPDGAALRLGRLCKGFSDLRASERDWPTLSGLMNANPNEEALLQEGSPPLVRGSWRVQETARWLEQTIFEFPGLLYDEVFAASMLGLSVSMFGDERLESWLKPCRYSGVLQPIDGRWWRGRLTEMAFVVMSKAGLDGGVVETFPLALEGLLGAPVERSRCVDCQEVGADTVCSVLRMPVKTEHSLAYFPDRRPSVMDPARVSFAAIQQTDDVDESLIDPYARDLVERLLGRRQ